MVTSQSRTMAEVFETNTSYNPQEEIQIRNEQYETGHEPFHKIAYSDNNSTRVRKRANPYSTSTEDIMLIAERRFRKETPSIPAFVNLLHHTAFEDGMSNDAIELVKKLACKDPYVAISWLYVVYGYNFNDSIVIDGVLRIIAFLEFPQVLSASFIPMMRLALLDDVVNCQESAIMLCEVWRTKECLDALNDAHISDPLLKSYAKNVIIELSEELYAHAS